MSLALVYFFFIFFYKNTFYKNIFQLFIIQYIKPEIILYWGMHSQYKMETNFCFVFEHIFFVIFEIEGSMSLALVQFLFKQIKNTFYKNTFLLFMTQCRNCFVMGCEIPLHDEFGLFGKENSLKQILSLYYLINLIKNLNLIQRILFLCFIIYIYIYIYGILSGTNYHFKNVRILNLSHT